MAVSFDTVKAGDTLYSTSRRLMGNTLIKTVTVHKIKIVSLNKEKRVLTISYDGRPEREVGEKYLKNLRRSFPTLIETPTGSHRIARKGEV